MQLNFATIIPVWWHQAIPSTLIPINNLLSAQAQAIFRMIEYQRVLTTLWQSTTPALNCDLLTTICNINNRQQNRKQKTEETKQLLSSWLAHLGIYGYLTIVITILF